MVIDFSLMKEATHKVLWDHKRTFGQGPADRAVTMRQMRMRRRDLSIPEPADPARKESCRLDLEKYLRTYHPSTYSKPFCKDHKRIITLLQDAIMNDGDQAIAADRSKGKSSIVKGTCAWAVNYCHRRFPLWIGATGEQVSQNYRNFKLMYERDEILQADFPEICVPVLALGGSSRGAETQTVNGVRTFVRWGEKGLHFPFIPGLRELQCYFRTATITGAIRGINCENVRPDFCVLDDIETKESVASALQTNDRMNKIEQDVAGLPEQGGRFSLVYIGSIMRVDCITDMLTDKDRNPSWNGERFRFMEQFPKREDMWDEYVSRYRDTANHGEADALDFLKVNYDAMHEGAVASWKESYNPNRGEMSAVHHFYLAKAKYGDRFVACEYQNDPASVEGATDQPLKASEIAARTNGVNKGTVPHERDTLTAFIDVKESVLHYCVAAFSSATFGGSVIDYGTHSVTAIAGGPEASVRAALDELAGMILGKDYPYEDGSEGKVAQALVDSGYGNLTETVYRFCRASQYANVLHPSKGFGIKPSDQLYVGGKNHRRAKTRRNGLRWAIGATSSGRLNVRLCVYDTNHWKTFLATRWKAAVGAADAMEIYGRDERNHRLFAEHQVAEKATRLVVEKTGVVYEQWQERRGGQGKWPNDWFDCLVGCCVAASVAGARLPQPEQDREPERRYRMASADELKAIGG